MLCEMRGYEGSMSAWNGSHGSADSSRGLCVLRKTEFGAYVVNSNQANSHSSYHHGENDSGSAHHHESRHQGYHPDSSRRHELRSSKMYGSQHLDKEDQKRRVERSEFHESHQPDYGGTASNHQFAMVDKYSGSHPQLSNTSENRRMSAPQETETNRSRDGSVARNIFQGPIVRVQVPEVYYEGGSGRGPETTAVAYKHNMSHNKDQEQMGEHLQRSRDMEGIHGSPVSETYRRINEWLKNCQQHSSTSSKSSHISHASNHSKTENKQKSTSDNFSKSDYRKHNQTGNFSNSKPKPNEPKFVASIEPKTAKAGIVVHQSNLQHKHRDTDWTEKREVPFRLENQSSAPRNNDVTTGAFSSKFNHVANTTKPFYESGLSKTSSEWSSETLSINGSDDKSSYCTDFTPFELDPADSLGGKNQMSTTASERPPNVAKNIRISQVMINNGMQRKTVAHTKEFSDALHDPIRNEFHSDRRNGKSNFHSGWNMNVGEKSKQPNLQDRLTDRTAKNPTDFGASLQTSKTGRVVTVFIGDAQKTQLGNAQLDNHSKQSIGVQNNVRYQKAVADPATSSTEDATLNSKIFDRRIFNGDRKSVQVPSETRLYTSDRKPMIPLRCTSLEQPLSSRYTGRGDQQFSIRSGDAGYKESSRDDDSSLRKQLESRPVAQLRSGSLSITIRPNRLTVMDYFKTIDDVWDSSGRKIEPELKGTVERSSYFESPQRICDDKATNDVALDINDGINEGLNSGLGDDVSDESEELDEFTKAVIKADISGKVLHSSSNTEFPSKPQYNVLKQSTNLRPNTSTLLGDVHSKYSGKIYQTIDDKHNESEDETSRDLKEDQVMFEGDIPQNSILSFRASQGLPQDARSSFGWIPGKSANSPDRDLQMKFNKNDGLVDDSFGHDSEYLKSKREDIIETDFRSNSEKKNSGMYSSVSESATKNSYPEFQSFVKNHSDSNSSSAHQMVAPDECYTDDRIHMETASPRPLSSEAMSEAVTDALNNHCELENVLCSKAKATDNKSYEEDRFLMSLLQGHTPELPAYGSICTPHLQSQNLVRTSDFTMQSNCGSDAEEEEDMPFRSGTDQFDKATTSVMKSPMTFEGRQLLDEEPSSPDFNLSTYRVYESPKEGGKDHSEEFYQQNSQETEYTRRLYKESPDSLVAVFVEGAATPAEIPRSQSQKSDSMTHLEEDGEQQDNNSYPGASFIINNTMKNSEPMYCQELIDFPENLVIDPPESFSDFTIML